jgi:glycosyltransferase involved in cell wall biosynthesis
MNRRERGEEEPREEREVKAEMTGFFPLIFAHRRVIISGFFAMMTIDFSEDTTQIIKLSLLNLEDDMNTPVVPISRSHRTAKLRILLIAEACNPTWTSVPLLAYSLARALAARDDLDVTLVTQVRNRESLESDPIANDVHLHYIDNEWFGRPFFRVGEWLRGNSQLSWTTAMAAAWPGYMVFEKMVHRRFGRDLSAHSFDLIHRISPLFPTYGSPLAKLSNVPMLIGPLNGGLPWPADYPELRKQEREWLVPIRGIYRWLPYHRSTYKHARGVIAGSWHTATEIPAWFAGRRYYLPENGFDLERIPLSDGWTAPEPGKRFRFVTVGRLVPYKGFDLILEAMAQSAELRRDAELVVIGDGPFRTALEAQTSELGLSSIVTFAGWIAHANLQEHLRSAQAFAFPSLREFGGGVVVEAMACGLPPIVVNYGGPGEIVSDECGIRLPMSPRKELVDRLSEAMTTLLRDPDWCRRMSTAALDRVRRCFSWPKKAAQIAAIYRDLLGLSQDESEPFSFDTQRGGFLCPVESETLLAEHR